MGAETAVEERLARWGGCARSVRLLRSGRDRLELRQAVASGRVHRVGRGCYALTGTPPDVITAVLAGGAVTCVCAARMAGLPLLTEPVFPHVALAAHRGAPRPGRVPGGTVCHWGPMATAPPGSPAPLPAALLHATACLPRAEAVALMDAALNRRLVTDADLTSLIPAQAGRTRVQSVVDLVDGRSQSLPETFARLALRSAGLRVAPQVLVRSVGWVDLVVEGALVVETDGYATHSTRPQFAEDRRRDRALAGLGVPVLRFTFADAVFDSDHLVDDVQSVLQQRAALPRPAALAHAQCT